MDVPFIRCISILFVSVKNPYLLLRLCDIIICMEQRLFILNKTGAKVKFNCEKRDYMRTDGLVATHTQTERMPMTTTAMAHTH